MMEHQFQNASRIAIDDLVLRDNFPLGFFANNSVRNINLQYKMVSF